MFGSGEFVDLELEEALDDFELFEHDGDHDGLELTFVSGIPIEEPRAAVKVAECFAHGKFHGGREFRFPFMIEEGKDDFLVSGGNGGDKRALALCTESFEGGAFIDELFDHIDLAALDHGEKRGLALEEFVGLRAAIEESPHGGPILMVDGEPKAPRNVSDSW